LADEYTLTHQREAAGQGVVCHLPVEILMVLAKVKGIMRNQDQGDSAKRGTSYLLDLPAIAGIRGTLCRSVGL